jgi:3-phenylpropionate/trans-cinnamate dioxygenase ferredoxin component
MAIDFIKVARTSDIPDRRSKRVRLEGEEIALWNVGGTFYAVSNICSHQHIAALHQGSLNGLMLTCPMHGWTYSLETGHAVSGNGRVRTYRVKVEGEDLFVEKPGS